MGMSTGVSGPTDVHPLVPGFRTQNVVNVQAWHYDCAIVIDRDDWIIRGTV